MNATIAINNESTTVILTCMANKTISYYWERYNSDNHSNTLLVGTEGESLVLHNVLPSETGRYRCVAENMYGKSYSNYATIFMKGITHCYL